MREVIHNFNEMGLGCLDPRWAGGRPRRISSGDKAFVVETAKARPESLGQPFTHWSLRKLARYLADNPTRRVVVGHQAGQANPCRLSLADYLLRTHRNPPVRALNPGSK